MTLRKPLYISGLFSFYTYRVCHIFSSDDPEDFKQLTANVNILLLLVVTFIGIMSIQGFGINT